MYKYTIIDKEHITVTNLGYPTLTISKIAKGRKFYAEPNSAIAFSPVYDPDTGIGSLKRYCITEGEKMEIAIQDPLGILDLESSSKVKKWPYVKQLSERS